MNKPKYRKIKIDIDYDGMIRHFEIDNEEFLKQYYQLQSNWNSLREWLKEQQKEVFHIGDKIGIVDSVSIDVLLDKMNELEGKDKE